jgi:hypothetical protein
MKKKSVLILSFFAMVLSTHAFSASQIRSKLSGEYSEIPGSEKIYVNVKAAKNDRILSRVKIDKSFEDYGYDPLSEVSDALILMGQRLRRPEIIASKDIFKLLPTVPGYEFGPYLNSVLESVDEDNFVALPLKKTNLSPKISMNEAENRRLYSTFYSLSGATEWLDENTSCVSYRIGGAQKISYLKDKNKYKNVKASERIIFVLSSSFEKDVKCLGGLLEELKLQGDIPSVLGGSNILIDALIAATQSQSDSSVLSGMTVINSLSPKELKFAKILEIERVISLQ